MPPSFSVFEKCLAPKSSEFAVSHERKRPRKCSQISAKIAPDFRAKLRRIYPENRPKFQPKIQPNHRQSCPKICPKFCRIYPEKGRESRAKSLVNLRQDGCAQTGKRAENCKGLPRKSKKIFRISRKKILHRLRQKKS